MGTILDSSSFCCLSEDLFSLWQRLSVAKCFCSPCTLSNGKQSNSTNRLKCMAILNVCTFPGMATPMVVEVRPLFSGTNARGVGGAWCAVVIRHSFHVATKEFPCCLVHGLISMLLLMLYTQHRQLTWSASIAFQRYETIKSGKLTRAEIGIRRLLW